MKTKQVHLLRRPERASVADFAIRDVELPPLASNQVLVENLYMSVDPYMRQSMGDGKDLEPWPLNDALNGPSVGRVLESRNSKYSAGDIVESMSGWQEHFVSGGEDFVPYIAPDDSLVKRTVRRGSDPSDYLALLGIAAQTGYFGMMCAAKLEAGKTLVVSSGAGTVGSIACQIGKIHGLRVVASAGSGEKVDWLRHTIGVDYAFNYKSRPISDSLTEACPDGIDLVLESASPEHMSACLPHMNEGALILIAGMISLYDTGGVVGNLKNFEYAIERFVTIKSYPFMDYLDHYEQFVADMVRWRNEGLMCLKTNIVDGLESAPQALCNLFSGRSHGKTLIRLASE